MDAFRNDWSIDVTAESVVQSRDRFPGKQMAAVGNESHAAAGDGGRDIAVLDKLSNIRLGRFSLQLLGDSDHWAFALVDSSLWHHQKQNNSRCRQTLGHSV